jgi:PAS domain S-box-containing protein
MSADREGGGSPGDRLAGGPDPGHATPDRRIPEVPANIYRLMVESARDYAIFALDPKGYIMTWNPGAQRAKGYRAEEIIGRHFSVFYPADDIAAGKPDFELIVAEAEGRVEDEAWRLRKDGTRFWANVIISALRSPSGELIGFGKVTRDLSERRRGEEALRESEERFRLLVQGVRDYGIFMLDAGGRVVSWNEGAQRIKGYSEREILGRHLSTFYPAEEVLLGKPEVELRVARAEGRYEDEGWRVRKDGTLFWANIVLTAIRNERGELIGFAKITRDLTERRAAQERAMADSRRVAEAEAANRAKSEFLAAMSHELRTPLNAIGGYTELLELGIRGPINEQQREDLGRIRKSQQHLLGIINDLLNFSRIEAGRVAYEITDVRLGDVIDAVSSMIEPQAAAKDVEVEWPQRAEHDLNLTARADRAKVEQIMLNLLTNAVKFTRSGGKITTQLSQAADHVAVHVIDTGIGIPPENVDSIFEPFVQVGRSLSSPHEGTGLGLAISRDLARAMGGELKVRSTLGVGSTFTLSLPLTQSSEVEFS